MNINEIVLFESARPENSPRQFKALIAIAAAAAVIVTVMLIPQTRALAVSAAQSIARIFGFANGQEVVITESENETAASVNESYGFDTYLRTENGRLIFSFDGLNEDITDQVSASDYFRYEKAMADGGKAIILVGGSSPEMWGWVELVFDSKGYYITNRMAVPVNSSSENPTGEEEWGNIAMHSEGVPCGEPYLDDQLE